MISPPPTDWQAEQRRNDVLAALAQVWDPELGLDVVSLGLVYDVRLDGDHVEIDMTLTTPGCPVSEQLPADAEQAVRLAVPQARALLANGLLHRAYRACARGWRLFWPLLNQRSSRAFSRSASAGSGR